MKIDDSCKGLSTIAKPLLLQACQTEARALNESRNFLQASLSMEFVALLPLILFQKTFYDTDAVYAHPS